MPFRPVPLLAAFSLVMAGAFAWYGAGWLAFLVPLPLLALAEQAPRRGWSRRRLVGAVGLAAAVPFAAIMFWLVQNDPADWARVGGTGVLVVQALFWLLVTACMTLGTAFFAAIAARSAWGADLFRLRNLAVLPAAWAAGEFLRSLLTGLVFWGPEGNLGADWNFGVLGFGAAVTPAAPAARVVGVYGLSFLAVLTAVAGYWLIRRRRLGAAIAALAGAAAIVVMGTLIRTEERPERRVGVLQVASDASGNPDAVAEAVPASADRADLLVTPEYTDLYIGRFGEAERRINRAALAPTGLTVGAGTATVDGQARFGQIVYRDPEGNVLAAQQKNFLIPGGEYLPLFGTAVLKVSGQDEILDRYEASRGLARSRVPERPVARAGTSYGTLACSGAVTPRLYRRLSADGAEVLVDPSSLAVLKDRALFRHQAKQMIRFQAVANDRPFVLAARGSRSYVIDRDGRFTYESPDAATRYGLVTVRPASGRSPYVRWGEWVGPAAGLLLAALAGVAYRKRPRPKTGSR